MKLLQSAVYKQPLLFTVILLCAGSLYRKLSQRAFADSGDCLSNVGCITGGKPAAVQI
jgi:hypothetical protein